MFVCTRESRRGGRESSMLTSVNLANVRMSSLYYSWNFSVNLIFLMKRFKNSEKNWKAHRALVFLLGQTYLSWAECIRLDSPWNSSFWTSSMNHKDNGALPTHSTHCHSQPCCPTNWCQIRRTQLQFEAQYSSGKNICVWNTIVYPDEKVVSKTQHILLLIK